MAVKLSNIDVHFISIVKAGANKRVTVFKSADGPYVLKERPLLRVKADEAKQIIYGVVYAPGSTSDLDTQGEFAEGPEIEKAMHRFMKEMRVRNVDKDHDFEAIKDAYVVENFLIHKGGHPLFPDEAPGAWAVGIRIEGKNLFNELKAAGYEGLSMAGFADRTELTKSNKTHSDDAGAIARFFKAFFGKEGTMGDTNSDRIAEVISEALKPVTDRLDDLESKLSGGGDGDGEGAPDTGGEGDKNDPPVDGDGEDSATTKAVKSAIEKALKPVTDRLKKLEKQPAGSQQLDPQATKANGNADSGLGYMTGGK